MKHLAISAFIAMTTPAYAAHTCEDMANNAYTIVKMRQDGTSRVLVRSIMAGSGGPMWRDRYNSVIGWAFGQHVPAQREQRERQAIATAVRAYAACMDGER